MNSRKLIATGLAALVLPSLALSELPQHDGYEHLGVQSCAASSCHGSAGVRNTYAVLQNEYITWARHDLHSRAYTVLKNEQSQRIAANLGLEAADTARICLDCHSDYVPAERRGLQFQLSDGVACEACHGGAEKWLGVHIGGGGDKHAATLDAGMYPTEDPVARAELCLSCHLGTRDKFATHEIMGAGHPRLSFDLQKFTDIQPRHYRVDKDYRARKNYVEDTRAWAIGQVIAARQYMSLLQGPHLGGSGLFPELGLFDCYACHHSFKDLQWQPDERTATPPGTVLLNDSSLAMTQVIASVVLPGAANSMLSGIRELHLASQKDLSAVRDAAAQLDRQLAQLAGSLQQQEFGRQRNRQMIDALTEAVAEARFSDYSDAEQATMALDVYSGVTGLYKNEVDALYRAVADDEPTTANRFDPTVFAAVFKRGSGATTTAVTPQPETAAEQRPHPIARQPEKVVEQEKPAPATRQTQSPTGQSAPAPRDPGTINERSIPVTPPETTTLNTAFTQAPLPEFVPTHRVNTDVLRVRFRPGADAGVRGLLYFGDSVQLLNQSGGWSRVTYSDSDGTTQRGWIASDFIDPL